MQSYLKNHGRIFPCDGVPLSVGLCLGLLQDVNGPHSGSWRLLLTIVYSQGTCASPVGRMRSQNQQVFQIRYTQAQ